MKIFKKNLRIFTVFILPRGLARKNKVVFTIFSIIVLLFASIYIYNALHPGTTDAAWWNDDWGYRIIANVSNPGSALSDYQISITVDTATLITAGKMQSDCDDIRITDGNGNLINHWIETGGKGCNTSTTNIWVKAPSLPTSGSFLYVYYGNPSASNVQNGNTVFEFFDDFSGSSLDQSKWMTGTIGSTSGTDWSVSGGTLAGGNNNRYIQSVNTYSGDYAAYARSYTTTDNTNGFTTVGFWASTSNGFGILDHNNSSYYRNDGAWVNFAVDGTGQWTQNTVKVVGTNATYTRTGETSGSSTTTVTNSGISAEYLRFGARYDSNALNQNFTATWDWVFVKKAVATEPTVSPGSEEKAPAPAGYWKFDEGTGITAKDSSSKQLNGTITGATWQTEDNCVLGKCLFFNENSRVDINDKYDFPSNTPFTLQAWVRATDIDTVHWRRVISKEETDGNGRQGYTIYQNINTSNFVFDMFRDGAGSSVQLGNGALNTWTHIAVTYDGSTLRGYVNGRFTDDTSTSINVKDISADFAIGAYSSGSSYFKGAIDEVKTYPYARSADQIKLDYNVQGAVVLGASTDKNLSNGLVGYWKMDESSWNGTSGEVIDSSGNGYNGTAISGTEATPSAKFGRSGYFAGVDEYVSLTSSISIPGSALTYAFWMNQNTALAGQDDIIGCSGAQVYAQPNAIVAGYCGDAGSQFSATITEGVWQHVVVVFESTTSRKIYINGALANTNTDTTSGTTTIAAIGARTTPTTYYNGVLDDFRIYNRALDSAEVSQLYNFTPGPVASYDFEEGQGTNANDKSGNDYNATLNGASWAQGKYGKGIKLDGTNDYLRANSGTILNGAKNYTFTFWVNMNTQSTDFRRIFESSGLTVYCTAKCSTGLYGRIGGTTSGWITNTGGATNLVGKWKHVAISIDDTGSQKAYVDGTLVNTRAIADHTGLTLSDLYIGSSTTPSYYYEGSLDDFRIYNYTLTAKQVVSDMNAGHPAGGSPVGSQVAYWKFDEGYGTMANDQTPKRNNGALNCQGGGCTLPAWTNNGKFGKALTFGGSVDANNNTVTITPTDANGLRNLGDVTISAWIKPSSSYLHTSQAVLRNGQGGDLEYSMYYNPVNQYPYFHWYDGAFKQVNGTSNSAPLNQWSHIVIVRQGTTVYFYVNGRLTNSAAVTAPTVNAGQLAVGRTNNASVQQDYSGVIDELKVYNYALSADEVKIDHNRNASQVLGAVGTESDGITASNSSDRGYCPPGDTTASCAPVGVWNFEEGQETTVNDTSGNGNSGTFSGSGGYWSNGFNGKAGSFNGTNNVVTLGSNIQLPGAFTYTLWFKRTVNNTFHSFTGLNTDVGGTASKFGFNADDVFLRIIDGGASTAIDVGYDSSMNNKWNFLTVTRDSSNVIRASLNGDPQVTGGTISGTYIVNMIGKNFNGQYMNGNIDKLRVFNYALSPAQIAWDYNRGAPVGHWALDECQGSVANDRSGNGNSGTITIGGGGTQTSVGTCFTSGTAWYNGAAGKFNYSLNFDGTDDYIDIPSTVSLPHITVGGWIKTTSSSDQYISERSNASYYLRTAAGQVCFWLAGASATWTCTTQTVNDGNWHHVIGTYDGSNKKIYIDGREAVSVTGSGNITTSTANIQIGVRNNSGTRMGYWNGQLDDIRIYNYALTPAQVKNLMNQGAVRFGPVTGSP